MQALHRMLNKSMAIVREYTIIESGCQLVVALGTAFNPFTLSLSKGLSCSLPLEGEG